MVRDSFNYSLIDLFERNIRIFENERTVHDFIFFIRLLFFTMHGVKSQSFP